MMDIAQNSISAGASLITLTVEEDRLADTLSISVEDNGKGMSPETVQKVIDPFYTTRTTRSVGLGVPLFKMEAEMTGGSFHIDSTLGKGTVLTAVFKPSSVDMIPLGDINGTVQLLISCNPGLDFIFHRTLRDEKGERLEEAMQVYGRIFDANCTYHVTPYEGMEEVLKELKGKGIKLAVLSNKPHRQTVKVAHGVFGEALFDYIQGQRDDIPRKPDPAGIYRILEKLQVPAEQCVYVGDSEVDLETGKRAGVLTIPVGWGFRTRQELEEAGAAGILERTEELLRFAEK